MAPPTTPGERPGRSASYRKNPGYTLIILMFAVFVMSLGLMVAVPVWETQIQREKEEELIFRGRQYVEAIRLFQQKKPGTFPRNFEELLEEKCLRKLYKDPMTEDGRWNVILQIPGTPSTRQPRRNISLRRQADSTAKKTRGRTASRSRGQTGGFQAPQRVLVAPEEALDSIDNPRILGVVSRSTRNSIKIYNNQESYDKWLFYYGQDPMKMPEIVYYGQSNKDS